jgi:hypothetical protein
MTNWWAHRDPDALAWLLDDCRRVQRGRTRRLSCAVGDYGEYLVWKALGGSRTAQASGRGDVELGGRRRVVEVKTTSHPTRPWYLGYASLQDTDFALVRVDPLDWSVAEAWFVPLPVARRHVEGPRNQLVRGGRWCLERHTRTLSLSRF